MVALPDTAEANAFVALLRLVVKSFSTWDLIEEFAVCQCFAVQEGRTVNSWAPEERWIEGIPMPDFTEVSASDAKVCVIFLIVVFTLDCRH